MREQKITVNSETELYGIFGNPVRHSLSPLIHNTLFQKFEINAAYLAFQPEVGMLGLAFEAMRAMGMKGANLTIPFKEDAVDFLDEIPEDIDRRTSAVNTVVNKNGQLFGYNTDGPGFLWALKEELRFNPEGKNILVLGAGGAARGVVFALARAHAETIWIHNRNVERAEGLKDYLSPYFPEMEVENLKAFEALKGEKVDLVVNATSVGMKGGKEVPMNLKILEKKTPVYDLVYSPLETEFLKQAKALGFPCTNGLGMLAAQAAFSFELWTGKREGVREEMLEVLKQCRF